MSARYGRVEIRISQRVLWIGARGIPVPGITEFEAVRARWNRRGMIFDFLRRAGAWAGLGVVALVLLGCVGNAVPGWVSAACVLVVLSVIAFQIYHLARRVMAPDLWALTISAGVTKAAVVSENRGQVYNLSAQLAAAINDPAVDYRLQIQGDIVFGDKQVGDRLEGGDKYVFGG
ncbi:DUF6232 family protein [Paractinoplanes lichenicola]|uniref:DUF304 domain-containing protein n=1 Tax=Paractinoplanes lichenicola TaxID=2802976 RepID=A0ABS1W5W6_9ACTN|nr:DUF6232 family protein [Actinoplanes lichenicola]MBL7262092.1 hypothetical protein [Actinoplanes lichenicola]